MEVYKAISCVQGELANIGIGKNKRNQQQGYAFRGIDDVYDVLAPVLAKYSLCIIPRCISRECVERTTIKGAPIFYVTVESEFHFVSAIDGSSHIAKTYGEAMDLADKATNKAMSAAYKYAAFQTFCIPVDVQDADATTHEVSPQLINKLQVAEIQSLIDAKNVDVKKFLAYMKCESIESIPASAFNTAVASLKAAKGKA